jgi:hypothetical protein
MSSLETVIENYYEHIFAENVLRYLVDRINKFVAFMVSNGIEQDRYLISVEPKFLDNGLALLVPFATKHGLHGRREESVVVFKVKQLSLRRVQVDCQYSNEKWLTPHVMQIWEKMLGHYERSNERVKEPIGVNQSAAQVSTAKSEKPQQKGRYRLTKDEIKRRKKIVKDAERIFRESNPKKTWKQIAYELDIPERTLRDWRHNPQY